MGATQGDQPTREIARHILGGGGRSRRDRGQTCGDGQEVLDAVAHLAGQQLMRLFGMLPLSDINENAEHDAADETDALALTCGRDPPNRIPDHDPEIDLVGAHDGAGGGKIRPHTITISGVDMRGQVLEVTSALLGTFHRS